jgi:DNA-binding winged helix-turn-helix (wHTH) protein/Tol biopolymer transport system component
LNLEFIYPDFNFTVDKLSNEGVYYFEAFRLDGCHSMLYRGGKEVSLPPKAVETLLVLVKRRGEILSKQELMDAIWPDVVVEETNLAKYLHVLRKTLGKGQNGVPFIETFRRRGYRFNGQVNKAEPQPEKHFIPPHMVAGPSIEREGNVLRVIDWQSPEPVYSSDNKIQTLLAAAGKSTSIIQRRLAVATVMLTVAGLAAAAFLWPQFMPLASTEPRRELSVTRLTNGAWMAGATISRDGNYFVYHEVDGATMRMFVQQTGQNSRHEILSSTNEVFHYKTFSPDGRWIYYSTYRNAELPNSWAVYRIPTIGGVPPVKVVENTGGVTFSPDGSEIAFFRKDGDISALLIADKDGRAERIVLQRQGNPSFYSGPAWSPDGKTIAFSEHEASRMSGPLQLKLVDVATGAVTPLSDEEWETIWRMEWMRDRSGIVMIGTRKGEAVSVHRDIVYFVSYPEGRSRRITNDGFRHEMLSLGVTNEGAVLAVPNPRSCQVWLMNSNGDPASAVQITKGTADGRPGLVTLPEGRIAYIARTGEELTIWVARDDGSDAKQLATGFEYPSELRADPQGRFLIFSATEKRGGPSHLYRINTDGTGLMQLTLGGNTHEEYSTLSPDGKIVLVSSVSYGANPPQIRLLKVSTNGGEPEVLPVACSNPAFSPDGSMITCSSYTELVIHSARDGREIERHKLPAFSVASFGTSWTPDGTGLIVIQTKKPGLSNLVVIPRDGSKPYNLTNFLSGVIHHRYAFSHDGSRLFVARGYSSQDAILIRNYR